MATLLHDRALDPPAGAGPPLLPLSDRKHLRARVIADHLMRAGHTKVVCLTCGNAARALEALGLDVLALGPNEKLMVRAWWTPGDVARYFPGRFDATSGHLPLPLMADLAEAYRRSLAPLTGHAYRVPTGSGETLLALRWAFPGVVFSPVYADGPTAYDPDNPLNGIVGPATAVVGRP